MPVGLLTVGTVASVLIGLHLSHSRSPRDVAARLGCSHVRDGRPMPGMEGVSCEYRGATVLVLHLAKGGYFFTADSLPPGLLLGPAGQGDRIVECQRRAACVSIQHDLGGDLDPGPHTFGVSLSVE